MTADLAQISRARVRAAEALVATARHHQRQLQALAAGLPPALQLELALLAEVGLHDGPPWTSPSALPAGWGLGPAAPITALGADPDVAGAAGGAVHPAAPAPLAAGDAPQAHEAPGGSAEGEGATEDPPGRALPATDPDATPCDAPALVPELEPELELVYDAPSAAEGPAVEPDLELIFDSASVEGAVLGADLDEASSAPAVADPAPAAAAFGEGVTAEIFSSGAVRAEVSAPSSLSEPELELVYDDPPRPPADPGAEAETTTVDTTSPDAVFLAPGADEAETVAQPAAAPVDDTHELEAEGAPAQAALGAAVLDALRRGAPDAAFEQRTSELDDGEDDAIEVILDPEQPGLPAAAEASAPAEGSGSSEGSASAEAAEAVEASAPAEAAEAPEAPTATLHEDIDPDDVFADDLAPSDTDTSRSTAAPAVGLAAVRVGPATAALEADTGPFAPDAAFGAESSPFLDDPDEEHTLIDAALGGAPSPWLPTAPAEEEATAQVGPAHITEPTTDPDQRSGAALAASAASTTSLRMPTLAAPRALGVNLAAAPEAPTTGAAIRAELEQGTGAHAHARTRPIEARSGPTGALRKPDPWAPAGPRVVEGDSAPVEPLGAAAIQILGIGKARTLTQTLELDGGMEEPPEEMVSANIQAVKHHEDDDPDGDLAVRFEEPAEDSAPRVPRLTEAPPTPTHPASMLTAEGILSTVAPPDLRSDIGSSELQRILREAEESERRGKLREAVVFYGDALEHDPELVPAWLGRGRCLVELSDYAAAMSDFSRAEDLAPESPGPAIEMGNLFFVRKEYAKAISHFDQALQLQPQHALALARRGTAHLHRKDQAAALADLQKAFKLDPSIPGLQRQLQSAQKKPAR